MSELRILCLLFVLSFGSYSQAQNPIQFSGLVVSGDSLSAVPYANILIQNKQLGTISNFNGFFSFVAEAGDTLVFSCVGYQKETFIIPNDYDAKSLVHIQHLKIDAIDLAEIEVTPWSNYEQFKYAFINTEVPNNDLQRAQNNLNKEMMKELRLSMNASPGELQNHSIRSHMYGIENQGMPQTLSFTNPMNWIGLIQMIQDGSIKDFYSNKK